MHSWSLSLTQTQQQQQQQQQQQKEKTLGTNKVSSHVLKKSDKNFLWEYFQDGSNEKNILSSKDMWIRKMDLKSLSCIYRKTYRGSRS